MKKFIYKMENILSIKYKMEEQAKIAYSNARIKLSQEEDKLNKLNVKLNIYHDKYLKLMNSSLKVMEINQCIEAIDIIKYYIKQQQIAVKKAEQQLDAARIRLNNAMIERKTHESLKNKEFNEFVIEYEAQQRKEIDELVSFKYNPASVVEE